MDNKGKGFLEIEQVAKLLGWKRDVLILYVLGETGGEMKMRDLRKLLNISSCVMYSSTQKMRKNGLILVSKKEGQPKENMYKLSYLGMDVFKRLSPALK